MIAATLSTWQLFTALAAAGGLVGLLYKLRPEREGIIAEAAEQAVEAMSGAFTEVRHQLENAQIELARVSDDLGRERAEREREREEQKELRHELKNRVAELEKQTNLKPVMQGLAQLQAGQREIAETLHTIADRLVK
jgi:paraquat-inducible protein B